MATVIHQPRDTRFGDIGRGLGNVFSSVISEQERRQKEQRAQEAMRQASTAKDPESFVSALAPVVEDQDDVNTMLQLATQRFGQEGRTKTAQIYAELSSGQRAPINLEVPASATQADIMELAQPFLPEGARATPLGTPEFEAARVTPEGELTSPSGTFSPQEFASIENVKQGQERLGIARGNLKLSSDRLDNERRRTDIAEESLKADMLRAEAALADAMGKQPGGNSVEASETRGFLRGKGIPITNENMDRASILLRAKETAEGLVTKVLEDPSGSIASGVGFDVISQRKNAIIKRANDILDEQFANGEVPDPERAYVSASNDVLKDIRPNIEGGNVDLTATPDLGDVSVGTQNDPKQLPMTAKGGPDLDKLEKGKWYVSKKGFRGKWNGVAFEAP